MAKWWQKRVGFTPLQCDNPEEGILMERFNQAAQQVFKALPKSERRAFFEMLATANELHTIEGYRGLAMGMESARNIATSEINANISGFRSYSDS